MMKKIAALLLSVGLVFSLSSCKSVDPQSVYAQGLEKTAALSSSEYDGTIKIGMDMGGTSVSFDIDMNIKTTTDKENPKMAVNMGMNLMGTDMEIGYKYLDGYLYVDAMGNKAKCAMDANKLTELVGELDLHPTIPADGISEVQAEQKDGNTVLTFQVSEMALKSFTDSLMSSLNSQSGENGLDSLSVEKAECTAVISADGYLVGQDLKMECSIASEGQSVKATIEVDTTLVNPGKDITIEVTDPDSYTETDASKLGL